MEFMKTQASLQEGAVSQVTCGGNPPVTVGLHILPTFALLEKLSRSAVVDSTLGSDGI